LEIGSGSIPASRGVEVVNFGFFKGDLLGLEVTPPQQTTSSYTAKKVIVGQHNGEMVAMQNFMLLQCNLSFMAPLGVYFINIALGMIF